MTEEWTTGIMWVLIAGLLEGTFMLPTKYAKRWEWENTWLSFSCMGYLFLPWAIALLTVPKLKEIVAETSNPTLIRTFLFGVGWGLGALTFGLGIDYLGMALGIAIIMG